MNYLLGPVLFLLLSWSLYRQLIQKPNLHLLWQHIKEGWQHWKFGLVLLLLLFNWGIEARKWQLLIRHLQPFSFLRSFKSVLSGCSITLLTPNRVGEYGGRILYVEEGNRIRAISLTMVGSISQLLVTLWMGSLGLVFLRFISHQNQEPFAILPEFWGNVLTYLCFAISAILTLFYLRLGWLVRMMEKVPALNKVVRHVRVLDEFDNPQLLQVMALSGLRYLVFVVQYVLLLQVMGVDIPVLLCFWLIAVFYLVMAIAPTFGFIELPVRVTASWMILQHYTPNELAVGTASLGIWLINLAIPAVLGSLMLLSIKIVKKQ